MAGTKERPRAAVYLRISRDSEQDGAGIERQRKDCTALARRAGLDVVEVYAENSRSAFSGRRRPQWDRMLEAVKDGRVSVVLAWANDRLYRRVQDQIALMEALRSHGGKIVTVKDGEADPTSDSGRMTMTILASVAAFESERKGERQKRKHEEIAAAGLWNGGPRPFGYRPVKVKGGTSLKPVPEEAVAIREAAAAILSGEGLRTVARRWNEAGLRTPLAGRKPSDPRPPYGGNLWQAKAVKGVLTSPMITGQREHRGSLTKAKWSPIVDRRTWKRLVAEFARRADDAEAMFGRPDRPRYLLTGILRCTCGAPLNGNPNNGTAAYACLSEEHKTKHGPRVRVTARAIEEHILTMAAGMERDRTEVRDPGEAPELQRALDEIDEKRSAFLRKAARLDMDEADISDGLADLNGERQRLEDRLAEEVTSHEPLTWTELADQIDAYVADEAADEEFFRDPETRAWVESLVERVEVRPAVRGRNRFDPSRFKFVWRDGVRDRSRGDPRSVTVHSSRGRRVVVK
ncbi:MAG: recombinase family protein [Actinomycetota bacterium]